MGGQSERDLVPANIDVRMVPGGFRHAGDFVDELYRDDEILELVGARDGGGLFLPVRDCGQGRLDLC